MADPLHAIRKMRRKVLELGETPEAIAPKVADAAKSELASQIAAGRDPSGKSWKRRQDGRKALANAADAIEATAVGDVVVLRIEGHHARHHLGAVRGKVRRQILPTGGVPAPMVRALQAVAEEHFDKTMGGN